MKYVAVITNSYNDKIIEGGWTKVAANIGALASNEDESYNAFTKRIEGKIKELADKCYAPQKGLYSAETGELIPPEKQRKRPIYNYLTYIVVEVF